MVAAAILDYRIHKILLSVSRGPKCIIVPNFVKIGRSIAEILHFFEFSRWLPPPSWIFEIAQFYWLLGSRGWSRINVPNFVKIGQSVAKILRFFNFSRWRSSAILVWFGHIWTTHSEYLGVSITLQNLVMINAVVYIIMNILICGAVGWKMPIHVPKIEVFGQ